jgi:hypothetical protein
MSSTPVILSMMYCSARPRSNYVSSRCAVLCCRHIVAEEGVQTEYFLKPLFPLFPGSPEVDESSIGDRCAPSFPFNA